MHSTHKRNMEKNQHGEWQNFSKSPCKTIIYSRPFSKLLSSHCIRERVEAGRLAGKQKKFYFKVPLNGSTHSFLSVCHWLDPGSYLAFNLKQDLTKFLE